MKKLKAYIVALPIVGALFLASCFQDSGPIILGTNLWPGYEPLYLARDRGLITNDQVRLVQYHSTSDVIREFRNGVINAAAVTLDEFLLLRETGHNACIYLIADYSEGADAILVRPPVQTLEGLKGRKVAVEASALGAYMMARALESNNIPVKDFEIVNLPVAEHVEAYASGKVDGAVTFEPYKTRLLAMGAKEIFSSKDLPNEIMDIIVINRDQISSREEHLKALRNGWYKALEIIKSQPQQAYPIIANRMQLSVDEIGTSLQGLHFPSREENVALLETNLSATLRQIEILENVMRANNLVESPIAFDKTIVCNQ